MFCHNCGSQILNNSKFCTNCGAKITFSSQGQTPPTPHNTGHSNGQFAQQMNTNTNAPPNHINPGQTPATGSYSQRVQPTLNSNNYANNQYAQQQQMPNYNQNNYSNGNFVPPAQANMNYVPPYNTGVPRKRKSKLKGCFITLLIIFIVLFALIWLFGDDSDEGTYSGNNTTENTNGANQGQPNPSNNGQGVYGNDFEIEGLREFYTNPGENGTDVHTIMVYLLGSDLESIDGAATEDIYEIMDAQYGDNINLVLMTGGSTYWYHPDVSNYATQYWQIKDGQMHLVHDFGQPVNMASSDTLANFINYSSQNFPADRYSIILWNHGGGTFGGFGYDENFPESLLTLSDIDYAFSQSSVKFDFVGFDACLMATAETALMLEPYADYLIASQELEPGIGWYYTDWLSALGSNSSMNTVDIGINIIDDFIAECTEVLDYPEATLSITELRKMPYTYDILTDYFANATDDIYNNEFARISNARRNSKDFGDGEYEQIDIIDFIYKADIEGEEAAINAVNSSVRYYNNSYDVDYAYGLAMYFPFNYPEYYTEYQDIMLDVGISYDYTQFFNIFISAMRGGQMQKEMNTNTQATHDYTNEDWYDEQTALNYADEYSGEFLEELIIDEKGDGYVLSLTDEEWNEISIIELQVLLDDGEGYIDLGSDNVYEFDDDGDLKIEFDYTWVTLDGHTVPFYAEDETYVSEDEWSTYGSVPALLNGEEYIEIIVYWGSDSHYGHVSGYRKQGEIGTPAGKGLFELEAGDTIEWIFDYYTYDWEYENSYIMGDVYTYSGGEIEVSYDDVGNMDAVVYFVLYDVYNNIYETEAIIYTD